MSNEIKWCERDVILSDDEITEIIRKTQDESLTNYRNVPITLYNHNPINKPNFSKAITKTVEAQRIEKLELQRKEKLNTIKRRLKGIFCFWRNKRI